MKRKFNKLVSFAKENKVGLIASFSGMVAAIPTVAHAAEVPNITTTMTTAFQSIVTQTLEMVAGVAPIGITIFAAFFCWKKGVQFFKTITKAG